MKEQSSSEQSYTDERLEALGEIEVLGIRLDEMRVRTPRVFPDGSHYGIRLANLRGAIHQLADLLAEPGDQRLWPGGP